MVNGPAGRRPVWREPGMPGLLLTTSFAFSGFAVLLPVAPMHAIALGGDEFLAGLTNAVLMATTILTQLSVERVRARIGWSAILVLGCLFLGLPALAEIFASQAWQVIVLAGVRGIGFGIITVSGASAVAALVEPERLGRAVGAFGLSVAGSQLVLTPTAPWIAATAGFTITLLIAAIPIVGLPIAVSAGATIQRLSGVAAPAGVARSDGATRSVVRGESRRVLRRLAAPIAAVVAVTCSGGAIMTFVPQFAPDPVLTLVALLSFTAASAVARWSVGGPADRYGAGAFIVPALGLAVLGLAGIAASVAGGAGTSRPVLLVVGALLVGTTFGVVQNVTLVYAFELAGDRSRGIASTAWNVAFDAGTGIGALAIGALASRMSFAFSFGLLAALCFIVAVALLVNRRNQARH